MKSERGALVAIDPGTTTGIAWIPHLVAEDRIGACAETVQVQCDDELAGVDYIVNLLQAVEIKHGLAHVIIEDFILRAFSMKRDLLAPVRITAAIETLAWEREVGLKADWSRQQPSAKGIYTKARQEALGLWVVGKPHGRDALLHLASRVRRLH